MTRDLALGLLVVSLLATAALIRPVWRAVDPLPAQMVAARDAWLAGEPLDPWGRPWYVGAASAYGEGRGLGAANDEVLASTGPDGLQGSAMPLFKRRGDDDFFVGTQCTLDGRRESVVVADTKQYEWLPAALVGLASVLLLTRGVSAAVASHRGAARFVDAGAVALVPTLCSLAAVAGLDLVPVLLIGPAPLVTAPMVSVGGSTFVLFFTLVFAHRELGGTNVDLGESRPEM